MTQCGVIHIIYLDTDMEAKNVKR